MFIQAGGERFEYIPALNDSPAHIDMLVDLVSDNVQGWLDQPDNADVTATSERAKALGAEF